MMSIMITIVRSLAKIHLGQMESFELGNLDSMRDWGHARDYVEGDDDFNEDYYDAYVMMMMTMMMLMIMMMMTILMTMTV